MTVKLDRVVRVGAVAVAALARRSVGRGPWPGISFHGAKRPVAVLIRRDGVTTGFEVDGTPIPPDDLERRFPGQGAAFERVATGDRGP